MKGKSEDARSLFYKILPLCRAMFLETNPIPVKRAMELMGRCSSELRLPMTPLTPENTDILKKTLIEYGIRL